MSVGGARNSNRTKRLIPAAAFGVAGVLVGHYGDATLHKVIYLIAVVGGTLLAMLCLVSLVTIDTLARIARQMVMFGIGIGIGEWGIRM